MKKYLFILLSFFLLSGLFAQSQNDSARESLIRILEADTNNYNANYQLGMYYYEAAVKIINETPYEVDLVTLDETGDEVVELFKQALPYLEKAYRLNPKKKEILSGLSALYFSLNELEKSNQLRDAGGY